MAMSVLLRSQNNFKVASALSNISRISSSISRPTLSLLENKNVAQFVVPKMNLQSVVKCFPIRQIATTAVRKSASGNHATLWTAERAVSAALLALLPAALMFPSKTLDSLLAISVVMHAHWGIEACVVDYVRPIIFGNVIPKIAPAIVVAFSALLLGGLLYFINTDIGVSRAIRKFWAIKGYKSQQ